MSEKQNRGFAAMPAEKQKEIARKGGQAHTREHLSRIGAAGGRNSHRGKAKKR